jgi:thiol-disulfide isomerase/thioredoxin
MDMQRKKALIGAGLGVGLLALWLMIAVPVPAAKAESVKKMPDFSGETVVGGTKIDNASLQGQVVLVNFWATWCPPCRKEIPSLIEMQAKYQARGFTILGISMDEGGSSAVRHFLEKLKVNYPVIIGDAALAREFGGVMGIPTSFLMDRQGNLIQRYDGYVTEEILGGKIEKLLDQQKGSH